MPPEPVRLGIALGGGFARGIAHVGVLAVFEKHGIPIHCIAGVSAGSIVAGAYASGCATAEIADAGRAMRFSDIARWSVCRMGLAGSDRMTRFLKALLKKHRFEEMSIPLAIVATDIITGQPVIFQNEGEVFLPIRASCSYPGLFRPVEYGESLLVDGAMSMEVPALAARMLGANRVVSVHLPMQSRALAPRNMFQVVNRCFQIMQKRTEQDWRTASDLIINPDVSGVEWDGFGSAGQLIAAGERAALAALDQVRALAAIPNSKPALVSPLPPEFSAAIASEQKSTVRDEEDSLARIRLRE